MTKWIATRHWVGVEDVAHTPRHLLLRERAEKRYRQRLAFWLTVFALIFLGAVFWISDRSEVCVSSMMVEVGQDPVTNPVTCSG